MEAQRDKWSSIQDPISHLNCFLSRVCDLREKTSAGRRFIFEFVSISENMLELKLHSGDHFCYMIFPFCRVKVSKTIFSEEPTESNLFCLCPELFFFFSVFRRFCGPANITELIKFSYFLGVWNHVEKISQELFFMGNWIKIYFPYKLREKSFKRIFFF